MVYYRHMLVTVLDCSLTSVATSCVSGLLITKKRTCWIVFFAVSADPIVKIKENEKRDKYFDFVRELKKAMEHEVDDGTNYNWCTGNEPQRLGKSLELEIGNYFKTTALFWSARILRRVLETCCHSGSSERLSANAGIKKSARSHIIIWTILEIDKEETQTNGPKDREIDTYT